jgi:hypothetical protein
MPGATLFSPLFVNDGGGVLLALPYEAIGGWNAGRDYDPLLDRCEDLVQVESIGDLTGVVVNDLDGAGILEAHWTRVAGQPGILLVVWGEWADPARKHGPENMKQVARAWQEGRDPRQPWLERLLRDDARSWQTLERTQSVPGGVLLLAHPEWPTSGARLAHPQRFAKCGQAVPVGLAPGEYRLETLFINEGCEGDHLCVLVRWVPAASAPGE